MIGTFGSGPSDKIIQRLEEAGYEAVFVGGAVRDYVLGKDPKDIDIATSAEPDEVKVIFPNTVDVGLAHGTVLVIVDGEPVEVTTFRTEGTYSDYRRPDNVMFVKSLQEDLLRRDFTMNALAMTRKGDIIDPFGGRQDLKKQIIRAVGNPLHRFNEDALRMLRAIRFSSVLDFEIEKETSEAIHTSAKQIRYVSIERVKMEMDKLFTGKNPSKALHTMVKTGLSSNLPLFPNNLKGLEHISSFETTFEGWAYFVIAGDFSSSETADSYKLSNTERHFISSVKKAYDLRVTHFFTIADYYSFDVDVLKTTEKIFHSMNLDCKTVPSSEIERMKKSLPINSLADLAVNGKTLIEWTGLRGGIWLGEWIGKIEHAVLHGLCENNPNKIKEWFFHEFNR